MGTLCSTGIGILWVEMSKLAQQEKSSEGLSGAIHANKILIGPLPTGRGGLLLYSVLL